MGPGTGCKVERPPSALSAGAVAGRSVAGWRDQAQDEVDALACRTTPCSGGGSGSWSAAANRSANGASAYSGPSGLGRRSGWTGPSGRVQRPDASYRNFVHEVRRYRLGTVLRACAETGALLTQERHGRVRLSAPNYVTPSYSGRDASADCPGAGAGAGGLFPSCARSSASRIRSIS